MSAGLSLTVLQLTVALTSPAASSPPLDAPQGTPLAVTPQFALEVNCPETTFSQQEFGTLLESELPHSGRRGSAISVYCHSGTVATIEARRDDRSTFTTLNFAAIQTDARPRAAALAAAETLLLLDEFDEHVESDSVEPTPVLLTEVPPLLSEEKAILGVVPEPKMSDELSDEKIPNSDEIAHIQPKTFLQAGPVIRSYLQGSAMAGATIELSWLGIGVGAEVLSGSNGTGDMGNTFNAYFGYDFLFKRASPLRGVLGARASVGAATTDGAAAAYVGGTAFGGMDFHLGRVWRTRILAEAGHAGWSSEPSLERLQGFFMGASLLLGASPEI